MLARGVGIGAGVDGRAVLFRQFGVTLRRGFSGHCGDFRGQQVKDDAVFVGGPHCPVVPEEGGTGGFLATEADGAVDKPWHKPLEANRNFLKAASQCAHHAVDHGGRNQGFTHSRLRRPAGAIAKQILNGHSQVVVGVHQAKVWRDNAVAVGIGVVASCDVELRAVVHQGRHGVGRGAVHADLAIGV